MPRDDKRWRGEGQRQCECGHIFKNMWAAREAALHGCPDCGRTFDADFEVQAPWYEPEYDVDEDNYLE